ncbi:MAG: transposase [Clostridia bacterium]|nr:transposase [Clostridia bacterium]
MNELTELYYTFVFCTRYRYALIKNSEQSSILRDYFNEAAGLKTLYLEDFSAREDHVIVKIKCMDSSLSPLQIAHHLRTVTSKEIRSDKRLNVMHLPSIWIRNIMVTTRDLSDKEIESFLSAQKRRS